MNTGDCKQVFTDIISDRIQENTNNNIIHIVCGVSEDTVHMITVYYPKTDKWEEEMKTRREK